MRSGPAQEVGGYELLGPLGTGGTGTVYRARDADGRIVALKMLHPHLSADPDARERLAREVANLRRVRHPAVAQVLDAETDSAEAFVVTELVEGVDLGSYVATRGPLRPAELAELAENLRVALCTVHAAGVLHRDLSPGNVMITGDGSPVLIDFSIAQAAEDSRVTSTGLVTGTPGYVAPELLEGGQPSVGGDWWGWASTLAFAATGRPPFGPGAAVAALDRARRGQIDLDGVEPRAAAALRAALAADPWRRSTPEGVVEELNRAKGPPGPPAPRRPPGPPRPGLPPDGETRRTVVVDSLWRTRLLPVDADEVGDDASQPWSEPWPPAGPPLPLPSPPPPAPYAPYGDPQYWLPVVPGVPEPTRRTGTVLALALPVVAVGVAWPVVALLIGAALVVVVRSIGLDADAMHRRRALRGDRRSYDVARGVLAWPWHLGRAAVGAVPALAAAGVVAAGLWFAARWVLARWVIEGPAVGDAAGVVPGNAEWVGRAVLAVVVGGALLTSWFGPMSRPTRIGVRWTLVGLGPGPAGAGVLVLAVLATTAVLAALMITHDVVWWPLPGPPGSA